MRLKSAGKFGAQLCGIDTATTYALYNSTHQLMMEGAKLATLARGDLVLKPENGGLSSGVCVLRQGVDIAHPTAADYPEYARHSAR